MGKIYKVKTDKNGKKSLSEALSTAKDTNTLELPDYALLMYIDSNVDVEVDHDK